MDLEESGAGIVMEQENSRKGETKHVRQERTKQAGV